MNKNSYINLVSYSFSILHEGLKQKIIKKKRNSIEVLKTHGDNKKILGFLKIKLARNIFFELPTIIEWYKKKQIWKLKN